jgi:hypothetical protein
MFDVTEDWIIGFVDCDSVANDGAGSYILLVLVFAEYKRVSTGSPQIEGLLTQVFPQVFCHFEMVV